MNSSNEVYDVIVIGAGISGLTAAYTIKNKTKNVKILILEARDRVGGQFIVFIKSHYSFQLNPTLILRDFSQQKIKVERIQLS